MKYIGWIVCIIIIITGVILYKIQYLPLKRDVEKLEKEIVMWESILKGEKGLTGDRYRFAVDRIFDKDELSPYGEVEILRKFDLDYKGIELYISAPHAFRRAKDVMRFLSNQRLTYKTLSLIVTVDTLEKFEYKFVK